MMKLPYLGSLIVALSLGPLNLTHAGIKYIFTPLNNPEAASEGSATGINDSGQIVGSSRVDVATVHAMLWNNSIDPIDLGASGGQYGYAFAINNTGQIVGSANSRSTLWDGMTTGIDLEPSTARPSLASNINNTGQILINRVAPGGTYHAALWHNNTTVDLPVYPSDRVYSEGKAINDSGIIVGNITNLDSLNTYAVQWNGNTITTLQRIYGNSSANDINTVGEIVGYGLVAQGISHAILWSNGTAVDLGTLSAIGGAGSSRANAINEIGQIVGSSVINGDPYVTIQHATLWENGTIIDLNSVIDPSWVNAGWLLEDARDINNNGKIVGTARFGYDSYAFLLTPIPEPKIYIMFLVGLGLISFMRKSITNEKTAR